MVSKPFKLFYLLLPAVCLLSVAIGLFLLWPLPAQTGSVEVGGTDFRVSVVATPEARAQGLSGHAPLGDREGMLFVFDRPGTYTFWMKDMLFPLDIIYIRDGKIVDMALDQPPPKAGDRPALFTPRNEADHVLEVKAGTAQALGWRAGTSVVYQP